MSVADCQKCPLTLMDILQKTYIQGSPLQSAVYQNKHCKATRWGSWGREFNFNTFQSALDRIVLWRHLETHTDTDLVSWDFSETCFVVKFSESGQNGEL